MTRIRDDERGVTLIMFAICTTFIFALIGIAIDGGSAYAERRQQQNAADSSAMAATRELDEHRQGLDPAGEIRNAAVDFATDNGSDAASVTCELVDENGTVVDPCPTGGVTVNSAAAGVRVRLSRTNETKFIRVVGSDSVTAAATATAQIQALRGGGSPFLFCAGGGPGSGFPVIPILLDPNGDGDFVDRQINPAAINAPIPYTLHGPQVNDCGVGDGSFKGLADPGTFALPGWWESDTGVKAGPTRTELADPLSCDGEPFVGCTLVVPLCTQSRGKSASTVELYCWTMGSFKITNATANEHEATFLGEAIVTAGQGGGRPVDGEARLIKLTD